MRICCAIAIVSAVLVGCGKKDDAPGGGGDAPAAFEVEASALYGDYVRDSAAADKKYLGTRIRVRGTVLGGERMAGGYAIVVHAGPVLMAGGGWEKTGSGHERLNTAIARGHLPSRLKAGVIVQFAGSRLDEAERLARDQTFAAEGRCRGSSGGREKVITISDARVVTPPR